MLNQISVKNSSGASIFLTRIGLTVANGVTQVLSTYAYEHEIRSDESLLSFIQAGSVFLVIDGTQLSKSESLRFFTTEIAPPTIPIKILSDSNVTSLSGIPGSDIDGVTPNSGDSILLTAQIDDSENGPWVIGGTAWVRSPSYPVGSSISGAIFSVIEGTTYGQSLWICESTEDNDIIGTDDLFFFQRVSGSGGSSSLETANNVYISIARSNVDILTPQSFENVTVV